MAESAKRHKENSNIIKEIQDSTDAAIRNQGALIKTLEIQIGQKSKVMQERGFGSLPSSTETNPRDQVKSISTAKADFSKIRHIGYGPYIVSGTAQNRTIQRILGFGIRRIDPWHSEALVNTLFAQELILENYQEQNIREDVIGLYMSIPSLRLLDKIKVIKEESEALGLLIIDDDLFTCDTPLGVIFNELNRLSGMDDDLFTNDVKIPELSYSLSVEQQMDNLYNGNLDVYERKLYYNECEKMYAEAVIFINKRLVRLIDVTVEQRLDLKCGDHTMVSNEVKESVIATWLIRSYKKQFDEYMIDTDIFHFETPLCEALKEFIYLLKIDMDLLTDDILGFKTYDEYKDAWIYEWNKVVPWVANMPCDEMGTNNEQFDEHELIVNDDDDIGDLEDYLIRKDPPYYVNEEEERSKERRCKLLRIPYVKSPTCKSDKFECLPRDNPKCIFNFVIESVFPDCRYGVSKLNGYVVLTI
ncbi:hypothetical protein Tco_0402031 [Tanacetum coccineum]